METIALKEVDFSYTSISVDNFGKLFKWKGKLYRGVYGDMVSIAKRMFSSGMIAELINKRFIPNVKITNLSVQGFGLVLEHEEIKNVSYPYEWSFLMFKKATELILNINQIAHKFGFQTKDGHLYNIVFDKCNPLFVDIGSFTLSKDGIWIGYPEFVENIDNLKIWASEKFTLANLKISNSYPGRYYFSNRSKMVNYYIDGIIAKLITLGNNCKIPFLILRLFSRLFVLNKKIYFLDDIICLKKLTEKIYSVGNNSIWGNYYRDNYSIESKNRRFVKIISLIKSCNDVESVTELASNEGIFSRMLISKSKIKTVTCIDNDEVAINTLYTKICNNPKYKNKINVVLQNIILPAGDYRFPQPQERFKSDMAVALAVTHHLLLSQGFSISVVLKKISDYSRKYVLIEYMPKGLWSGNGSTNIPDWYTTAWFKKEFCKEFTLLGKYELETNRVLFFGKLKKTIFC